MKLNLPRKQTFFHPVLERFALAGKTSERLNFIWAFLPTFMSSWHTSWIWTSVNSNEYESVSWFWWHRVGRVLCGPGWEAVINHTWVGFYRACWRQSSKMYGSYSQVRQKTSFAFSGVLRCRCCQEMFSVGSARPFRTHRRTAGIWELGGRIFLSGSERPRSR